MLKKIAILKGENSPYLFLSRNESIKIRAHKYLKVGALVHGALVADLSGVEEDAVGAALLPPRHHHVLLHLQGGPYNNRPVLCHPEYFLS